ncbi:MAG TPA: RelA/SpoT domain-containing protein [Pyrinomonadaceae bacterium]|nr:RelA/SpoT domain-containing protein [Pyrinomonadaceae bacterium]
MSANIKVTKVEKALIKRLVAHYRTKQEFIEVMLGQLSKAILGSPKLMAHVHSTKTRIKDPEHLEDKLLRKLIEAKAKNRKFTITEKNLLYRINDLAGFRILHLHTEQIVSIDRELRAVFDEYRFPLYETPRARTWDDESRDFFQKCGIETVKSPTMYTSVHYVVESNSSTKATCEIQVRTLAEELWGEVDHTMNYPHECSVTSCREQIKVLARVTSSCSRLVDSIFRSYESGE